MQKHKRKWTGLLLGCVFVICSLFTNVLSANAVEQFYGDYYGIGLDYHDESQMEKADGWSNGDMFNCTWRSSNVTFSNGNMNLKIDRDYTGGYNGGEYRTKKKFGYGMYDVSLKAIKNDGVVTSFFTYTGPTWFLTKEANGSYVIKSATTGKVVDVEAKSKANGGNVIQWQYNGGANQQWYIESVGNGYYKIINVNSGKALDVSDHSMEDNANVLQWEYKGDDNQHWKIEAVN